MEKVKKKKMMNRIAAIILFLAVCLSLSGQQNPFDIKEYDFISYEDNYFRINDALNSDSFFNKMDELIVSGKGKLNIVQIGDSHIQADYVSGQFRKNLQEMAWGLNGGRGFIFPVRIAGTNNPWNYSVNYTGNWDACKNVEDKLKYPIGLAGFTVVTNNDASVDIRFRKRNYPVYGFDKLKVYHKIDTAVWEIDPGVDSSFYSLSYYPDSSFSMIEFENIRNRISLNIRKKKDTASQYHLRGFLTENNNPGIVYHSVGVNGAEVESWLKCENLTTEIKSINPDMIIISLGTNDSYTKSFDKAAFEANVRKMVKIIRDNMPDAAILWVTPNDNYRYRRYLNYSTSGAVELINELGEELNFMVWDFYKIMGELNSMSDWLRAGLGARDRLHFNKTGYLLQADLMYAAFLQAYYDHINKKDN